MKYHTTIDEEKKITNDFRWPDKNLHAKVRKSKTEQTFFVPESKFTFDVLTTIYWRPTSP